MFPESFLFFLFVLCFTSDSVSRLWKPSSGARTDGRSTSCSTPANSPTTPWCMWVLQVAVNLHPAPKMPPRVISYSDRQSRGRPARRGHVRSSFPHGEPSRAEPGWRRGGRLDGGEAEWGEGRERGRERSKSEGSLWIDLWSRGGEGGAQVVYFLSRISQDRKKRVLLKITVVTYCRSPKKKSKVWTEINR